MEDIAPLWSFQENIEELKQKLLCTTLELESVKMEANEEKKKNKECVKQLLQLLKIACKERDEARDQLQKLLHVPMLSSTTPTDQFFPSLPQIQSESPLIKPGKANSSITESGSFSDTYNYSHGSSPVSSPMPKVDQATLVIDEIVKGKALPQKGKLLQAVLEAGPLLETLIVAGPLPQWRNPPPLQHFKVPLEMGNQKPVANLGFLQKPINSAPFLEMSCGSSQVLSASTVLNFAGGASGSCLDGSGRLVPAGLNANCFIPLVKRQRLH
ncbi:hypothetical protein NMG60_11014634 [Bertholletia excelsa]